MKRVVVWFFCSFAQLGWATTLLDDAGHRFQVTKAARIVTLTPHFTELVFSVGAGDRIVATVDFADYPEAAKTLRNIGGYAGFNIEAIVALQPDLILYWPAGNPARDIERLRSLGLPLFALNTTSLEDIAQDVRLIGELTGQVENGKKLADDFLRTVDQLRQANAQKRRLKVFYQLWHQPIISQNKASFISQIIELCGGENIFAQLPMISPQISVDAVLAANPDVIIASGVANQRPSWLDDWQRYPSLKAIKNQQLYFTNPDWVQRPSLRVQQGAQQLCEMLDQARSA